MRCCCSSWPLNTKNPSSASPDNHTADSALPRILHLTSANGYYVLHFGRLDSRPNFGRGGGARCRLSRPALQRVSGLRFRFLPPVWCVGRARRGLRRKAESPAKTARLHHGPTAPLFPVGLQHIQVSVADQQSCSARTRRPASNSHIHQRAPSQSRHPAGFSRRTVLPSGCFHSRTCPW